MEITRPMTLAEVCNVWKGVSGEAKKNNARLVHLQSHTSQTDNPIFASIHIYWRFFDFQYSPDFCSFGKNWIQDAKDYRKQID